MATLLKKAKPGKKAARGDHTVAVLERKAPLSGYAKPREERLRRIHERTQTDPVWRRD